MSGEAAKTRANKRPRRLYYFARPTKTAMLRRLSQTKRALRMYMLCSLSLDKKKRDTYVNASFFQPLIRRKQLGN